MTRDQAFDDLLTALARLQDALPTMDHALDAAITGLVALRGRQTTAEMAVQCGLALTAIADISLPKLGMAVCAASENLAAAIEREGMP